MENAELQSGPLQQQLMRFAAEAFANAEDLHLDAKVLFKHRRYPRAASLAIIGAEEAGKALILCLAGLGQVRPDQLPKVLRVIRQGHSAHATKHALSSVAGLIGEVEKRIRKHARKAFKRVRGQFAELRSHEDLVDLLRSALTPDLTAALQKEAARLAIVERDITNISDGAWQELRDAGLYVDLDNDLIQVPRRIRRPVALQHVKNLGAILHGVRLLLPVAQLSPIELAKVARGISDAELKAAWSSALPGGNDAEERSPPAVNDLRLSRDPPDLESNR